MSSLICRCKTLQVLAVKEKNLIFGSDLHASHLRRYAENVPSGSDNSNQDSRDKCVPIMKEKVRV